ncbi:hypothetical protein SV7mr_16250 [Stieleria bergensis]|uniref:Uncharacterized protein n=1 Tax=Stieleria bergensis TaxID=2528025 RepID=A0A517SSM7_9BACT|nr:hypothetical protein SV7mr_16250 [Planctomycetes bacterium SV_7m_r]
MTETRTLYAIIIGHTLGQRRMRPNLGRSLQASTKAILQQQGFYLVRESNKKFSHCKVT